MFDTKISDKNQEPQPFYIEWKRFVLLCLISNIAYGIYMNDQYIIIVLRTVYWLMYGAVINGVGLKWTHYYLNNKKQ